MKDNTYIKDIIDEFYSNENPLSYSTDVKLNENELKSFIIKDLKSIGADIKKIKFFVEIYGLQKRNIKINPKDNYTYELLFTNTRKQLERKLKIESLNLNEDEK